MRRPRGDGMDDLDDAQRFDFDSGEQFSLVVGRKSGDLCVLLCRDDQTLCSLRRSKALRLRRVIENYAFTKPRPPLTDETKELMYRIDDLVRDKPGITLKQLARKLWPREAYKLTRFRLRRAISKSEILLGRPFEFSQRDRNTIVYPPRNPYVR